MNSIISINSALYRLRDSLGEDDYLEPLTILIESLKKEANLSFFGSLAVMYLINNQLRTRSKVYDFIKNHHSTNPSPPIFIMGLPRSGTTFLFHLLGQDSNHRSPSFWEILHLFPLNKKGSNKELKTIRRTDFELSLLNKLVPEINLLHPIHSDFPEECTLLTALGIKSYSYIYMANVLSYQEFLQNSDFSSAFLWHSRFLQVLEKSKKPLRWLLKDPNHLEHLKEILTIYPEAHFIHIHRDPTEALGSICSITSKVRKGFSKKVDKLLIGKHTLSYWENAMNKYFVGRSLVSNKRIFDLQYKDLISNPIEQIKLIYSHFGYELGIKKENVMRKFLNQPSRLKKGKHIYALKDFGLTKGLIREKFDRYISEKVDI